jgi:hypothetical protein
MKTYSQNRRCIDLILIKTIREVKKKHSADAHGIFPYMLRYIPNQYWRPILQIFNDSLYLYSGPSYWKILKMKLLAKKDSICSVKDTRPISLLDTLLRVLERLMLTHFQRIVVNRGILHDS